MNNEKELQQTDNSTVESSDLHGRREALKTLGKYSAYVAPFTIMALSAKGAGASGPGPSSRSAAGRR
jgi:hypothetical protein